MDLMNAIEQEELKMDREKLKNFYFNYNVWVGEFIDEYLRKHGEINEIQMDMVYKVMSFVERKMK